MPQAMPGSRAGRVYLGRVKNLTRRTFLRQIRYLDRDGRHSAILAWNETSLADELDRIDTLARGPAPICLTTFVTSYGTKELPATDALNELADALRISASDIEAAICIAHGLPQEDSIRHVHTVIASRQPLNTTAIYAALNRQHAGEQFVGHADAHNAAHSPTQVAHDRPDGLDGASAYGQATTEHRILGSRRSASRLAIVEEQHGLLTFRQHVRAHTEQLISGNARPATWHDIHSAIAVDGLTYTIEPFGNAVFSSSDGRWRVAASLVDPALALPTLTARLGPFVPTSIPPNTCTYEGRVRTQHFSEAQWQAFDAARARYRDEIAPTMTAQLAQADRTYKERLAAIRSTREALRDRVGGEPLPDPGGHYDAIETLTSRARENIKAAWFEERAAIYASHERAPDRAIGRWLSHRPPVLPPATNPSALAATGARAVSTADGIDYYRDGIRIATDVDGQLRATTPEAFVQAVAPHVQQLQPPKPVEPIIVSGRPEAIRELRALFHPSLELEDAVLFEPATEAERQAIEAAANDLGLRLADPYALARLEREGRTPEAEPEAQPRQRPTIKTRERRRRR
jgi:hypothetical protein